MSDLTDHYRDAAMLAEIARLTAERDQLRADNTKLQNEVVLPLRERMKLLEEALVEVLEFQSAPTQPTIHDWGCWRRVLHARAALGDKTPNV